MARTNKMGILKQKQQVAKQKKILSDTGSVVEEIAMKREFENPKGNVYLFFKRGGKWICDMTNTREDADGYRLIGSPNSGDVEHRYIGISSWGFRRFTRSFNKTKIVRK